jgi:hypothetical protein
LRRWSLPRGVQVDPVVVLVVFGEQTRPLLGARCAGSQTLAHSGEGAPEPSRLAAHLRSIAVDDVLMVSLRLLIGCFPTTDSCSRGMERRSVPMPADRGAAGTRRA